MKYQNVNMFRISLFCLTILFLGLMSASITHAETYSFVTKWGSAGTGDGQFYSPQDIKVDLGGNVYVADNRLVKMFDSSGVFLTSWQPASHNIAVNSFGNVYVLDSANNSVQKFDNAGNFITQWNTSFLGYLPVDHVAVDSSDNVYVANSSSIEKFGSAGNFIAQWNFEEVGDGQINGITDIAADSSGNVYIIEFGRTSIMKFDSNGNFITKWGSKGHDDGQFSSSGGIQSIAVDSSSNVYALCDSRVQKFDSNGNFITKWGSEGYDDGQLSSASDIAVDSSGNVYVLNHDYVQMFAPTESVSSENDLTSNTPQEDTDQENTPEENVPEENIPEENTPQENATQTTPGEFNYLILASMIVLYMRKKLA